MNAKYIHLYFKQIHLLTENDCKKNLPSFWNEMYFSEWNKQIYLDSDTQKVQYLFYSVFSLFLFNGNSFMTGAYITLNSMLLCLPLLFQQLSCADSNTVATPNQMTFLLISGHVPH